MNVLNSSDQGNQRKKVESENVLRKVTLALVGAGQRVLDTYERYALQYPYEVQFVAVAEPHSERRERFKQTHAIQPGRCFADWRDLLAQPKLADAVLICTQDRMHFGPAMAALQADYHLLLEKPLSPEPAECLQLEAAAEASKSIFMLGHTLRYTNLFATIKHLLDDGKIGQLISIQHSEHIAYWHYAHAFVRGNWSNSQTSSPLILSKSCHDMDLLLWLAGANCTQISSFGSLSHFTLANAPQGAPLRCLDGCPVARDCLYYAPNFYLTGEKGWPASAISDDTSTLGLLKALQEGPYGKCVYHCNNNVVDHQVVNMAFENAVTAVFSLCAFSNEIKRTITLLGTKGELHGISEKERSTIEVVIFRSGERQMITLPIGGGPQGYGGGDFGLMKHFVSLIRAGGPQSEIPSIAISVQSHLMAFAAEKSRQEKSVITMEAFRHLYDE
jgi:predicted dehydrogenase